MQMMAWYSTMKLSDFAYDSTHELSSMTAISVCSLGMKNI